MKIWYKELKTYYVCDKRRIEIHLILVFVSWVRQSLNDNLWEQVANGLSSETTPYCFGWFQCSTKTKNVSIRAKTKQILAKNVPNGDQNCDPHYRSNGRRIDAMTKNDLKMKIVVVVTTKPSIIIYIIRYFKSYF
jgi:hypothetical protein